MKKLLAIIPTYNEAGNIEQVIRQVFAAGRTMPGWECDILIVDDTSPDGTADIVRRLQTAQPRLRLLSGPKAGLGKAYLRGFIAGLADESYNVFLMMDADLSHDPKAIPSLVAAIEAGADYVIGSRYVRGGQVAGDWPSRRKVSSLLANLFARLFVGTKGVTDFTGGFKAIRVSSLRQIELSRLRASGYVFQVNLLHEFSRGGFRIAEVPITFTNRSVGTSKLRLRDIIEFGYLTYRLNPQSPARRLIRFGLVGLSGTVVNLAVISSLIRFGHTPVLRADVVAIEVSIISNFWLNHLYTFRAAYTSPRTRRRDTLKAMAVKLCTFNAVSLGGAAISFAVFALGYRLLGAPYVLADLLGIIVAMGWNYWLSARLVWKVVDA